MQARVEFLFQGIQHQALALDPRQALKSRRNNPKVEMRLTTVEPPRVAAMSFRLIDDIQFQRLKRGQLGPDSIANGNAHG